MIPQLDYLAAEGLIKERLQDQVDQVPDQNVLSATDLDGVKEKQQATPALHVIYAGDKVQTGRSGSSRKGKSQIIDQYWQVTVAVRNVSDKSGEHAREDASPIILALLDALQGHKLGQTYSELQRLNSPYKPTCRNGFAYFSFLFSTRMHLAAGQ